MALGALASASLYGLITAGLGRDLTRTAQAPVVAASGPAASAGTTPPAPGRPTVTSPPSATWPVPAASSTSSLYRGVTCAGLSTAAAQTTARRLQEAIATALEDTQDRVSVAVHDWRSATTCSFRSAITHDSASIVKVTTVATLLWQRAEAGRSLSATEKRWAEAAITISDNAAQSALWSRIGGNDGAAEFMQAAGMTRSAPVASDKWGLTQVTAADELRLLRTLAHGSLLRPADRNYLLGLMRRVDQTQRWGVPTGAPAGSTVAVKNGWLDEASGWHVNSIGYVTGDDQEHALVVLSDGYPAMQEGVEAIEAVARAVHASLDGAAA